LVPSLASLGHEPGFAIKSKAKFVRVRTYQGGDLAASWELKPDRITRCWRSQWAPLLPVTPDELHTVELDGDTSDLEAEILLRNDDQQSAVLTGLVPLRASGFKFAPIVHQAHYNILLDHCETYVVFTNLVGEIEQARGQNKLQVEIRNLAADVLAVTEVDVGFNSTFLLPVREFASRNGADVKNGLSLRIRGGASQFAIFTAIRNLSSNAIGIEHSLPPIYFTEAPFDPALRVRFHQAAFGDLKR
jgi:hypothetical protein